MNDSLVDYLYQELDADELDRIENHLKECEGCASDLEAFESTRQLMRQLPELEPSSAVTDRLLKEAAQAIQPEETVGFWDRVRIGLRMLVVHPAMTAAVALVLVLGVSFYAYRHTSPPKHEEALRDGELPEVEKALRVAPTGEPTPAPPAGTVAQEDPADEPEKEQQLNKDETLRRDLRQAGHRVSLEPRAAQPTDKTAVADTKVRTVAKSPKARRRPKRRRRRAPARLATRPRPQPKPKSPYSYRKGPAKPPEPAPSAAAESVDEFDDDRVRGKAAPQGSLAVTGGKSKKKEMEEKKAPGAHHWLLRARMSSKKGQFVQALRLYHKALEREPRLRRTIGKEIRYCARNVAHAGTGKLEKIQQQLPLLAGWLEAEITTARRRARKKAAKRKTSETSKASGKKKAPAAPAKTQQKRAH